MVFVFRINIGGAHSVAGHLVHSHIHVHGPIMSQSAETEEKLTTHKTDMRSTGYVGRGDEQFERLPAASDRRHKGQR